VVAGVVVAVAAFPAAVVLVVAVSVAADFEVVVDVVR
jgi:hypothetical protein